MASVGAATQGLGSSLVDKQEAMQAVRTLLCWIGEDPHREGLLETPDRVVRAMREMHAGYHANAREVLSKTFAVETDEMVVVRDIAFQSTCEHHMLPFTGRAHVAYIPSGGRVVGLSKIPRLVECYARRLQVQERLTRQIADALMDALQARGAAVMVDAAHSCMVNRGVRQPHARMATTAVLGVFRDDAKARDEFYRLLRG